VGYLGRGLELRETTQTENLAGCYAARAEYTVFIETARHLPHTCLASGWGNKPDDKFSSEVRSMVLRAATLVSGPTAVVGDCWLHG